MAVPSVRAVGTVAANVTGITPGMPAGTLKDDILLLFLMTKNEAITVSGGTETWAEVADSPQGQGTAANVAAARLTIFWARASQNTPTSPTTSDSGNMQLGRIVAYSGCITSGNPYDVTSGAVGTSPAGPGTFTLTPGDTTTVANCRVVIALAVSEPDATSTTVFDSEANSDLASITVQIDNSTTSGLGGSLDVFSGSKVTAGSYGNSTVHWGEVGGGNYGYISIALKPPSTSIKTINGLAYASVKTVNGLAVASVKTWNGLV